MQPRKIYSIDDWDQCGSEYALLRDRPWTESERATLEIVVRTLVDFDMHGGSVTIEGNAVWIRFVSELTDAQHVFLVAWLEQEANRIADQLKTDIQPLEVRGSLVLCPTCGRWFDVRDLDNALEHAEDGHRPRPLH